MMSTPWQEQTLVLEEKAGPYADYAAWEQWFARQQLFDDFDGSAMLDALDALDFRARIALYVLCSDLCCAEKHL